MSSTVDQLVPEDLQRIFDKQKENRFNGSLQTVKSRKQKLKALYQAIKIDFRQEIRDAMMADFRKPEEEVDLSEILVVLNEIKHALHHLGQWARPKRVGTPLALLGSTSTIYYEPKGVCLIISPWNFPFNLSFGPLVSAIAAGNSVILKPSEMTPGSSQVIRKIVEAIFLPEEVYVVEGGIEVSTALLELPFNHIFFTGSPTVGKIVMKAASRNLASVTLELGGKSPTIIDQTANIEQAARRIAWGKHLNAGQICIAPDYLLVHESKKTEFLEHYSAYIRKFYGNKAAESTDYPGIVNRKHAERLKHGMTDALQKGAKLEFGGQTDTSRQFIEPTVITDLNSDSLLMNEEIFGPVSPVIAFRDLKEVTDLINEGEVPLALYMFSNSQQNIDYILANTKAGSGCINMVDIQFFNHHLPFGGLNNSGIGKSHGYAGFLAFTNERSVLRQWLPGAAELIAPPYTPLKKWLIKVLVDYL